MYQNGKWKEKEILFDQSTRENEVRSIEKRMEINNQYNEYLMQSDDKNYIELEISDVLKELDSNRILSEEDRLELKDYFLNEVENLNAVGLNDREALLIAKKRFGVLEDVNVEYQKVKPGFDLLRFGIIGVVGFCMIKIFTISIDITSQLFWLIYYQFDPAFVRNFIVMDVPFRFLLIIIFGFIGSRIVSRVNFRSLASLWKFPIFYILAEVLVRIYYFVIPMGAFDGDISMSMEFFSNSYIVNYPLLAFIMVFASYKMYKMKVLEMEYV